ncbi:MAG TPA: cupin domain-containing protein [Stellaceae bacterium]|jgi:mannose-6-phosphate isomerase-like protein (cupin superfamily)
MGVKGFVVPPGGGTVLDMAPDRFSALKLLRADTADSIMLFEENAPPGAETTFHLHHDSDEVAYILAGEVTMKIGDEITVGPAGSCAFFPRNVPHAWKNTGTGPARILFLYTPGKAGGFFEEALAHTDAGFNGPEADAIRERNGWKIVGPPPF